MFNQKMTLGVLLAVSLSWLGCDSKSTDSADENTITEESYSLVGESCDYLCSGPACNLTCEDNVIYRCESDNTWHLEEDCVAQDSVCVATEPDMEQAGNYTWVCEQES